MTLFLETVKTVGVAREKGVEDLSLGGVSSEQVNANNRKILICEAFSLHLEINYQQFGSCKRQKFSALPPDAWPDWKILFAKFTDQQIAIFQRDFTVLNGVVVTKSARLNFVLITCVARDRFFVVCPFSMLFTFSILLLIKRLSIWHFSKQAKTVEIIQSYEFGIHLISFHFFSSSKSFRCINVALSWWASDCISRARVVWEFLHETKISSAEQ